MRIRKIFILNICLCLLLCFTSCSSNKVEEKKEDKIVTSKIEIPSNVGLGPTGLLQVKSAVEDSSTDIISGMLEKSEKEGCSYVIFDKYTSRSKTGYYVIDELTDSSLLDELEERVGTVIKVRGSLVSEESFWTKEIKLGEIL